MGLKLRLNSDPRMHAHTQRHMKLRKDGWMDRWMYRWTEENLGDNCKCCRS